MNNIQPDQEEIVTAIENVEKKIGEIKSEIPDIRQSLENAIIYLNEH